MIGWIAIFPLRLVRGLLRRLPRPVLARLDAWSQRRARQRASLRRQARAASH